MADQISLGKNGKLGKIDLSRLQAGVKKSDVIKDDPNLESVFDIIDKNKDGVLDRGELDELQKTLGNLAGEDNNLKKKEVKNYDDQKLGRSERKSFLQLLNNLDGVTPEDVVKAESKKVNGQLTEVVTFKDGHKEIFDAEGKRLQKVVTEGTTEKTYNYDGDKEILHQTIENKGIAGKEKTTEFEYDEQGNVIAQNITTDTKAGKATGRYEIDPETGNLLPKTSVLNKGSENEVVTNFELQMDGMSIISTSKTADGELKVLYEITDEKNPDGTSVLKPKSEILTTKDGYKQTEYKDDGVVVQTQKEGDVLRTETHEKDGTIKIVVENGDQYTRKTINPDKSYELSTNMNESGSTIIEKYNVDQDLVFQQVTDADNNITQTIVEDNKITVKQWDKDNNYTETVKDKTTGEVISENSALGAKARAENKKQEYISKYGHLGLDPNSVDRYISGNNKINVQMQLPKGRGTEKEHNGYKYTEYENYEAKFQYNSDGEVTGVNYIPKYKQTTGTIIGNVKGSPNTVIVAAKDVNTGKMNVYYVDRKDGKIRSPKNVRGEIAFNTAKDGDRIQADIVDAAGNGNIETQNYSHELVYLKDANGKPVMRNGYRVAVDKYGNESLIADGSTLKAKDLVAQNTLTFNRDGKKVDVTIQYGQDGKPIRGNNNSVMVKDANGKTLFITDAQYKLHKARQEHLNNAGNGKHLAVRYDETKDSRGYKVASKFLTAESIANNPELAASVTKSALQGMKEELAKAREDYEKYRTGDLQSWDHRMVDGFSRWFGSENYSGTVHQKLDKMEQQLNQLLSTDDPAEFQRLYKEFSGGKDLDSKSVARFYAYANETSRKNAFGDQNARATVDDYVDSQYSAVENAKQGAILVVGIGASIGSGGLLTPALATAGVSMAWGTGHLATTGEEVDWSLLHKDENGSWKMGDLGEVTWESMKEGAMFYGAGKGYQIIEKGFGKGLVNNFMEKTGQKLLDQTERRLSNLGVKEAEKELARLTAKQNAKEVLTKTEQEAFELLTKRQAIMTAAKDPTINNLNKLVEKGIVKDEFFEESLKEIPKEMLPKTVAFDAGSGVALDIADMSVRATLGDEEFRMPTAENVLTYAGMSLVFQKAPGVLANGWKKIKNALNRGENPVQIPEFTYGSTFKHQDIVDADPVIAHNSSVHVKTNEGIAKINTTTDNVVRTSTDGAVLGRAHNELDALSNRGVRRSNQAKIDEKAGTITADEKAKFDQSVQQHHQAETAHAFARHNELSEADFRTIGNSVKDAQTPADLIALRRGLKNKEYTQGGVTAEYKALEDQIDNKLTNMIRNAGADDLERISKQLAEMKSQIQNDARLNSSLEHLNKEIETRAAYLKDQKVYVEGLMTNGKGVANNAELEQITSYMKTLDSEEALQGFNLLRRGKKMTGAQKKLLDEVVNAQSNAIKSKKVTAQGQRELPGTSANTDHIEIKTEPKAQFKKIQSVEEANKLFDDLVSKRWIGEDGNNSNVVFLSPEGWSQAMYKDKNFRQGTQWKIHIYADSPQEWANAAQVAMPYLEKNRVDFKTVTDLDNHFQTLREYKNSEGFNSQTGKAFTVYFESEEEFLRVAQGLEARFKESGLKSSGTVANEAQIGDSGFLSYRHEGAERGTVYKPEGVEDPYLKLKANDRVETSVTQKPQTEVKPSSQKPAEVQTPVTQKPAQAVNHNTIEKALKSVSDAEVPSNLKLLWNNTKQQISDFSMRLQAQGFDKEVLLSKYKNIRNALTKMIAEASGALKEKLSKLLSYVDNLAKNNDLTIGTKDAAINRKIAMNNADNELSAELIALKNKNLRRLKQMERFNDGANSAMSIREIADNVGDYIKNGEAMIALLDNPFDVSSWKTLAGSALNQKFEGKLNNFNKKYAQRNKMSREEKLALRLEMYQLKQEIQEAAGKALDMAHEKINIKLAEHGYHIDEHGNIIKVETSEIKMEPLNEPEEITPSIEVEDRDFANYFDDNLQTSDDVELVSLKAGDNDAEIIAYNDANDDFELVRLDKEENDFEIVSSEVRDNEGIELIDIDDMPDYEYRNVDDDVEDFAERSMHNQEPEEMENSWESADSLSMNNDDGIGIDYNDNDNGGDILAF